MAPIGAGRGGASAVSAPFQRLLRGSDQPRPEHSRSPAPRSRSPSERRAANACNTSLLGCDNHAGVFVLTHLRGGGEYGSDFWHDGRFERKQHTFDDLYAAGEALITAGTTTREQLAGVGASNGGLLTGAAVTQRPDLFRVVVSMVPLYDMLKFQRDPYTATCVLEYGDPNDPRDAEWLYAYSPYHNVREADYPATLIYCGTHDMRCWPWQSRKLAAQLQAANTGQLPVLLRAAEDGGHLSVMAVPERVTEWMSFLMSELRMDPAT
jgi:prolyl oligopeptidase